MNNEQYITPTGSILTPIRRVKGPMWLFHCTTCSEDKELWPELIFDIRNIRSGRRPCGCSKKTNWKDWQFEIRVRRKAESLGLQFIGFDNEFSGSAKTICKIVCPRHGEFTKSIHMFLSGQSCTLCGNENVGDKLRIPVDKRIKQINKICIESNIKFNGFVGSYKNKDSRISLSCLECDKKWATAIHSFVKGSRCPSCCGHGYDPNKDGFLYLLISRCGKYMKIGITNNPLNRFYNLRHKTPFEFNIKFCISMSGRLAFQYEKEILKKYSSAEMSGFSGATEWLIFDKGLLLEEDCFVR